MAIAGDKDEFGEKFPAEELAFADEDERLPWLESDDDYEEGGVDTGRLVTFIVGSLVLLAAIIGGGYFLLRDRPDPAMVADGSVIEAPEAPYKEKPADPGGSLAAGTGDTSFAVAEGRTPPSRLATGGNAPAPSIDREPAEAPTGGGGVGVQVGAYSSKERAEEGWQALSARHPALSGVSHRVTPGMADGATVFRLQAVAGSAAGAQELCANLKAAGADCQVKN
ncbi:SPOR domain-containing protein [Tsuneonella sp. HG222]